MKLLIALTSGISTTLGEKFLLHILFPNITATQGVWVLIGLLSFNCGGAGLLLF
jgi:hypothetical protein